MTDKYIVNEYKTSEPDFFEKCLPVDDLEHQKEVCDKLRSIIKFDSEMTFIAYKKFGTENYKIDIPATSVEFYKEEELECNNCNKTHTYNGLKFSNGTRTIPLYVDSKPMISKEYISFEYDRYYPKINENGEVEGFTGYMFKKKNIVFDECIVENINNILIKENEIIINDTVILPMIHKAIHALYNWNNTIKGLMISRTAFYFENYNPEDYIDPENIIEKVYSLEKFSAWKVSIENCRINQFWGYFNHGPKIPRIIKDEIWEKICINFPKPDTIENEAKNIVSNYLKNYKGEISEGSLPKMLQEILEVVKKNE
jgi:hypothetical protein